MTPTEIKEARRKLGLSAKELAKAVGIDGIHGGRTVRRWEAGDRKPSVAVVILIQHLIATP